MSTTTADNNRSTSMSSPERKASVVSQRIVAYEQRMLQKRRVSDTIEGRRLDELSTVTNSTTASTSTLSTRTKVDNPTADADFEVQISQGSNRSNNSMNKGDEALLGTHVSFADGEECGASCTSSSVIDDGEEKLMAAIASATGQKRGAADLFRRIDQQTKVADGATKAIQEVERVFFFTDVIDRNAPVEPPLSLPSQASSSPNSSQSALVASGSSDDAGGDMLSSLLTIPAVAFQGVCETVYRSSVEAYHEAEKTCKEVERNLLFTDLPDAHHQGAAVEEKIETTQQPGIISASDSLEVLKSSSIAAKAELNRVFKSLEETLLFTDLPDDAAIYHSKSLPTTRTTAPAHTGSALAVHQHQPVNSSLSMCHDVQRTFCFTDLDEQREQMLKDQSNLMSQVLLEKDNQTSLVTSADLQRLQARIDETKKALSSVVNSVDTKATQEEQTAPKEVTAAVNCILEDGTESVESTLAYSVETNDASKENNDDLQTTVATDLEAENAEDATIEEEIMVAEGAGVEESEDEGSAAANSNTSSDEVRLLVEVSVATSKSVEEIDELAAADDATSEKESEVDDNVDPWASQDEQNLEKVTDSMFSESQSEEQAKEKIASEEDPTEELTDNPTEESLLADADAGAGAACEVSPVDTEEAEAATDEYSSSSAASSTNAGDEAATEKGTEKFDVLLAERGTA